MYFVEYCPYTWYCEHLRDSLPDPVALTLLLCQGAEGTCIRNISELCTARIMQDDVVETYLNKSYLLS